jgi:hypothetical protein
MPDIRPPANIPSHVLAEQRYVKFLAKHNLVSFRPVPRALERGDDCCCGDTKCDACRAKESFAAPNPYDAPIADLRVAHGIATPTIAESYTPPNPYNLALDALRRNQ